MNDEDLELLLRREGKERFWDVESPCDLEGLASGYRRQRLRSARVKGLAAFSVVVASGLGLIVIGHASRPDSSLPAGSPPVPTEPLPCASADLSFSQARDVELSMQGAVVGYTLTNTGRTRCLLQGYPTVAASGPAGAVPLVVVEATRLPGVGTVLARPVTLPPGGSGRFYLSAQPKDCLVVSTTLRVTLPGGTKTISVPNIPFCPSGQRVAVSPVLG